MLIECPECGKQISDKSKQCIHCGFPIKKESENNICIINDKSYDFSLILDKILNNEPIGLVIRTIRDTCNMSMTDAKKLYNIIDDTQKIPHNYRVEEVISYSTNIPRCPTCNSTNLSKITTTKKVAKVAAFGIFGMGDNGKTWKCNICGSKF